MPHNSENEMELPPDADSNNDEANPRRRAANANAIQELGVLTTPTPLHALDRLVLHESAKTDIEAALRSIERRAEFEIVWNINAIQPQAGRCMLNFYGPPGTGKTRAALGAALRVNKPLYQVDYSQVISKYLGDTAKHISTAFKRASELNAVLFFDEADSLLSRRVPAGKAAPRASIRTATCSCRNSTASMASSS